MHHHTHTVASLGDLPGRDEIFVFKDIFIEKDIEKISPTSENLISPFFLIKQICIHKIDC